MILHDYTGEEFSRFLTKFFFKFDTSPEAIEWIEDENVPRYWRAAKIEGRDSLMVFGPEGTYYSSKKGISEAIQADQDLTEDEKEKFVEVINKNKKFVVPVKLEEGDQDESKSEIKSKSPYPLKNKVPSYQMKSDDLLPKGWFYTDLMTERGESRRIFGPNKTYFGTGHAIKAVFDEEGDH